MHRMDIYIKKGAHLGSETKGEFYMNNMEKKSLTLTITALEANLASGDAIIVNPAEGVDGLFSVSLKTNPTVAIGTVVLQDRLLAAGTITGKKLAKFYTGKPIEGVITDANHSAQMMRAGLCVIAEVMVESREKRASFVSIEAKVGGTIAKYPAKAEVVQLAKTTETYLSLRKDADANIVTVFNGQDAGVIDKTSVSTDDFALLETLIESEQIAETRIMSAKGLSYTISIQVREADYQVAMNEAAVGLAQKAADKLATKGYDAEMLNAISGYIHENGGNSEMVNRIFATYKPLSEYSDEAKALIPTAPKTLFKPQGDELQVALAGITCNMHLLFSGPKGTGKNTLIETLAWIYQRPLYAIAINAETDKADLLGSQVIEAVDTEHGVAQKITFSPEVLIDAMRQGGIINIDEVNFGLQGVMGVLHSVMDDRRGIQVPGYEYVQADENFMVAATMNVGYAGTRELSEALADRFLDVQLKPSGSIAPLIEAKYPGVLNGTQLAICENIYTKMVEIIQGHDGMLDDSCLTQRGFFDAAKLTPHLGLKKALIVAVAHKVKDEEYQQNLVDLIQSLA